MRPRLNVAYLLQEEAGVAYIWVGAKCFWGAHRLLLRALELKPPVSSRDRRLCPASLRSDTLDYLPVLPRYKGIPVQTRNPVPHTMDVTIIIPVHNGGEAFRRCLDGIAALTTAPAELIVVPDGESDGTWRIAEAYGARVLEPGLRPFGPARARNRGAEAAASDLLFFVDADVIVHPDALDEIAAAFRENPDLDALIGSYDDAPGAPSFLSQYRNLLHHYVHQTASAEASTFWGACGVVRRTAFLSVGGFDADRFALPSVEDIELGYRLKQAGYTLGLRKTLLVKHLKHWSAVNILRTDVFQRALPWTELILEHDRLENNLNTTTASRVSVVAAGALAASLVAAPFLPALLLVAAAAALLLVWLNAPLYRFFWEKRGPLFTLGVLPWHWLYYLYGGLAFAYGAARFHLARRRRTPDAPVPA